MLVNNNPLAVSTIEKLKRTDMDPANAAASTLYSGALQAAQQSVTVPAAQKELDKAADRIDDLLNAGFLTTDHAQDFQAQGMGDRFQGARGLFDVLLLVDQVEGGLFQDRTSILANGTL